MKKQILLATIAMLTLLHLSTYACMCIGYFHGVETIEELAGYEFIALAKVVGEKQVQVSNTDYETPKALLKIQIIEKFKGAATTQLTEDDVQTSCDMGIGPGDEWLFFAKKINNKLTITPCDRNVAYRKKDGKRDWQYRSGIQELDDLRRLFSHTAPTFRDGIHRKFYPNKKTELEATYKNGLKNGPLTVYFPDGKVNGKEFYVNDTLQGKSEWYYPSGQLRSEATFERGRHKDVRRVYHDTTVDESYKKKLVRHLYGTEDSLRKVLSRGQLWMENVYDKDGNEVISRRFSRSGKKEEEIVFPKPHQAAGRYEEFDKAGNVVKSWDYDEAGRPVPSSIRIKN